MFLMKVCTSQTLYYKYSEWKIVDNFRLYNVCLRFVSKIIYLHSRIQTPCNRYKRLQVSTTFEKKLDYDCNLYISGWVLALKK